MRRPPHPANHRLARLIPRAATLPAGATIALLALALATSALHSPFLLLLPLALRALVLRLPRAHGLLALAIAGSALGVGELVREQVDAVEALVLVAALLLLARRGARRPGGAPALEEDGAAPHLPARPPEQTAREALAELERQLGHLRAWSHAEAVALWEVRGGLARPLSAVGRAAPSPVRREGDPLLWVAREGTPAWLEPTPHWSESGWSVAAARVWQDAEVAWVVTWEFPPGAPRESHEALAAWCGPLRVVLDVLSAQSRAVAGQERLTRLLSLLHRIPLEIRLERFGEELLHAAMTLLGATGGALGSWRDEHGQVVACAGHDGGPAVGAPFGLHDSELGIAILAGAPIVRETGQWRPGLNPVANPDDEWLGRPRTLVTLPLVAPSGSVGAISLWSTRASRLDTDALELVEAVLPYAALHLVHAREYGRLQETADRDPLTGLRNRRGFESAFEHEATRYARYGHPLALLMIDIDHFKSINDQHGHEAGDDVLRAVARVLERTVRDVDVTARFGGEEFIVLLPETDLRAAAEAAERVRSAVEQTPIVAGGRELPVRVSIGASACPDRAARPDALIGSADAALYEAKRGGRNQVQVAAGS